MTPRPAVVGTDDGSPAAGEQAPERTLEQRVRSGASWSALNTLVMRLGNIAITAVVLRIVAPKEFGVFIAAMTIATILTSVADWGVSVCLTRGDLDPEKVGPAVATVAMVSGLLLAVGVYVGAAPLASLFGAPEAAGPIRIMSICLLVGGVTAVPHALLNREFRQSRLFLSSAASFVPANAVLVVLAWQGFGANAFAWSRVIAVCCEGAVVVWSVRRWYRPTLDPTMIRFVLRTGIPLAGANLLNYTLLNADYAFVSRQLGPALLAVYVLAFNIASWPTSVLSSAVTGVAGPAFSRVKHDSARLSAALARSTRAISLVALPIAAIVFALAEPIVVVVYGSQWSGSVPILRILSMYGATFVFVSLLSNLLVGSGRTSRVFVIQIVWIATLVPIMIGGLRFLGVSGVAWAHVVVVLLIVLPLYLHAVSGQASSVGSTMIRAVLPPLAASLAAGAVAAGMVLALGNPIAQLFVGGSIAGIAYLLIAAPMLAEFVSGRSGGLLGRILALLVLPSTRVRGLLRSSRGRTNPVDGK